MSLKSSGIKQAIESRWYGKPGWLLLLLPLTWVYLCLVHLRRKWLTGQQKPLPVPVIVVGNITVGGTGKTPLLIALVRQLQSLGLRPGVISRGYGASGGASPQAVASSDDPAVVGDEPLLIAQATGCPMVIGRDRYAAARTLLDMSGCDVILSDDGLQHYSLARDLELVVVDAGRGFGNGYCLPVGPLREPVGRLHQVNWVVRNGNQPCQELENRAAVPMRLRPVAWVNVKTGDRCELQALTLQQPVNAIAGIGNPQRFFSTLTDLGLTLFPKIFPDHYRYSPADFKAFGDQALIMTAKDAVKCRSFAEDNWWYLDVAVELPASFLKTFTEHVQALVSAP